MASTIKQILPKKSLTVYMIQQRHISKTQNNLRRVVYTTRPVPRGTERRILNAVTAPVYAPDPRPPEEICLDKIKEKEESRKSEIMDAYNAFKLKEAKEILTQHQMVAICLRLPTTEKEYFNLRAKIFTAGLHLKFIRNDLAIKATKDTHLCNLQPYFSSSTAYIVSETPQIPELIKVLKKCPELHLLGGLVHHRIMSKDEFVSAAKLPDLDVMRGELLTILKSSASKTKQLLSHHQQGLSQNLTQLVKQGSESDDQNNEVKT